MKKMKLNKKINVLVTFGMLVGMMGFSSNAISQQSLELESPSYYQEQFNSILDLSNNDEPSEPSFGEVINYSSSMQDAMIYSLNYKGKIFWFAIPSLRDQLNQQNKQSELAPQSKSLSRDGFI